MTDEIQKLIDEMTDYCDRAGISTKRLSRRAAGSSTFFERLTNHRDCTFRIAARVRLYMEENPIGGDE